MRRVLPVSIGAALGAACAACSLLTSYDGFTGGPAKGSRDGATADAAGVDSGRDAGTHDSGCVMFDGGCLPPTPPGWTGPLVLLDGPVSSTTPCPGGAAAPHKGYANLIVAPASCTPCSCGTVEASCSVPQAEEFPFAGCPTPLNDILSLTKGGCRSLDLAASFIVTESSPVVSCPASGGAANVTAPIWAEMGLVCSPATSDGPCPAGSTCVAATEPPFDGFCIYAPGTFESCPAGSVYQTQHVYYAEEYADSRGCTKCECVPPHANCDSSTDDLKYFGATDTCTGSSVAMVAGECRAAAIMASVEAAGAPTLTIDAPGICIPSGGQSTGTAAGMSPFTVCCM